MSSTTTTPPLLRDYTPTLSAHNAATDCARFLKSWIRARGDVAAAAADFEGHYPRSSHLAFIRQKSAVAAGSRLNPTWASPLSALMPLTDAVVALARPASVLSGIPYVSVPANCSVGVQTGGAVAGWVGEGAPSRVVKQGYAMATVPPTKVVTIITISAELVRLISPAADATVRDDLVAALAAAVDGELLDQTRAPVLGVNPGSILFNVPPIPPSGVDAIAAAKDADKVIAQHLAANPNSTRARLLLSPSTVVLIKSVRPVEQFGIDGGSFCGVPIVVSGNVGNKTVCVDGASLLVADDGAEIDASKQAAIQMDDNPDSPAGAGTVVSSFWQANLIGVKATRYISWKLARAAGATWCGPTAYTF